MRRLPVERFLREAWEAKDPSLFFTVFSFFEERNIRARGTAAFRPDDAVDIYVQHFNRMFPSQASIRLAQFE